MYPRITVILLFLATALTLLASPANAQQGGQAKPSLVFYLVPLRLNQSRPEQFQLVGDDGAGPKPVIGGTLHTVQAVKGDFGSLAFDVSAQNNKMTLSLSGILDQPTNPSLYQNMLAFGDSSTPSLLLTNGNPVEVTVQFDIATQFQANFATKPNPKDEDVRGQASTLINTPLFRYVRRFDYYSGKNATETSRNTARRSESEDANAHLTVTARSYCADQYDNIPGTHTMIHRSSSDGKYNDKKYKFRLNVMELVDQQLRQHPEIKMESSPNITPNSNLHWDFQKWLEFNNFTVGDSRAKSSATIKITVSVKQLGEEPPTLAADFDFAAYVKQHQGNVPFVFRREYGGSFWQSDDGPRALTTGHKYLSINPIGKSTLTAEAAARLLKANIEQVFPGNAKGVGGSDVVQGRVFAVKINDLTRYVVKPKVTVTRVTPYDFTFQTVPGTHPLKGTAIHGIFRDAIGELWMYQQGRGVTNEATALPLINYIFAKDMWIQMAGSFQNFLTDKGYITSKNNVTGAY